MAFMVPEYEEGTFVIVESNAGDTMRANARLIAASPDLLAIAESTVSLWGFMAADPAVSGAERKAAERNRDHARDVLARIRGE